MAQTARATPHSKSFQSGAHRGRVASTSRASVGRWLRSAACDDGRRRAGGRTSAHRRTSSIIVTRGHACAAEQSSAARAGSAALEAEGLDFVAQPVIGELVVVLAAPAGDDVVAIGRFRPGDGQLHALAHLVEVARALDGIRHGGEEHVGIARLHVLDRGGDVFELLAFVTPHEEHADLDALLVRQPAGATHLFDLHAALHGVEDLLAAALRADPDAIAAELAQQCGGAFVLQPVGARDGFEGPMNSAALELGVCSWRATDG